MVTKWLQKIHEKHYIMWNVLVIVFFCVFFFRFLIANFNKIWY